MLRGTYTGSSSVSLCRYQQWRKRRPWQTRRWPDLPPPDAPPSSTPPSPSSSTSASSTSTPPCSSPRRCSSPPATSPREPPWCLPSLRFHLPHPLSPFFLQRRVAGFLLLSLVIPVDGKSNFGNQLSRCFLFAINRNFTRKFIFPSSQNRFFFAIFRYILKHITGYFPITLHADDIDAFDPNQAYGDR